MSLLAQVEHGPAEMPRHQPMRHMAAKSEMSKVDGEHQLFPFSSANSLVTLATPSLAATLPFARLTTATGAVPSPDSVHTTSLNVTI